MSGIVDEDIDWTMGLARVGDAGAQRRDIGKIDIQEVRAKTWPESSLARRVPSSTLMSKNKTMDF